MSTDGGSVWIEKDSYYSDGGAVAADPSNTNNYWSGGHYTFAMFSSKTTDACDSWTRYYLYSVGMVNAIAVDPLNPNVVYAGGYPGVYKTTNAGGQWNDMSTGMNDTIAELAIHPSNTDIVYAATNGGVYKTVNGGTNWFNTGCSDVTAVVIDPSTPETLYAATNSGVYYSTNGGGDWTDMSDGLNGTQVTSLDINPGEYLFAGTVGKSMYRWSLQVGIAEDEAKNNRQQLLSISPNPTHDYINITYMSPDSRPVTMRLYDASGRFVTDVFNGNLKPGLNEIRVDADRLVNGIYFLFCDAEGEFTAEKVILSR